MISGSFVKRQRKRPSRVVSSERVVLFHLISVAERGHAVRTVHRVTCHRTSSESDRADLHQKIVFSSLPSPSEQLIALLVIVRRRSQIVPIHTVFYVVNIRLTARLQTLPLARC